MFSVTKPRTFEQWELRPALCLDLDGTVRYSASGEFIEKPEDIRLYPGVEAKIWQYRDDGYLVFGVTNQGGVAFGYKTPADHQREIAATLALFERNPFHTIKASFSHEGGDVFPYSVRSLLRKPHTGMLALCEQEAHLNGFVVDWDRSLLVGDREEDQACAQNAGIAFQWADDFFDRGDST